MAAVAASTNQADGVNGWVEHPTAPAYKEGSAAALAAKALTSGEFLSPTAIMRHLRETHPGLTTNWSVVVSTVRSELMKDARYQEEGYYRLRPPLRRRKVSKNVTVTLTGSEARRVLEASYILDRVLSAGDK